MRITAPSPNVTRGGFRAALLLTAVLIALLLGGVRPSGAAVGAEGFPVATGAENEMSAAVSGNTAVWEVSGAGGLDIQGKNLATGQDLGLPSEPGGQQHASVDGRIVVWQDTSSGDSNVYGYDLSSRQKFPVAVGPGNQARPSVDGNRVVWEDDRGDDWDVYGYDLDAKQEFPVSTAPGNQRQPVVGGATVVWEQRDAIDSDIVAKDLATGEETTVAGGPSWQETPAVGGDTILWSQEGISGSSDVYGYDLAEGRELGAVGTGGGDQYDPAIGGRVATWVDDPGGNADIRGKDLSTGESFVVAGGPGQQENPAAGGNVVLWEIQREGESGFGTLDVLGARLDLAPVAPGNLVATGSEGGVKLDWAEGAEPDLAGYNVYRAASEGGEYAKLNTNGLLSASSFDDAQAPKGARAFYKVTAVDTRGSESAAARANAVVPKESGLSLSASPTQIPSTGGLAALSGRLTSGEEPLPDKAVVLQQRPEGAASWGPVAGGQLTTAADGGFFLAGINVDRDTDYRAVFGGTEEALPSTSAPAHVDVQTMISVNAGPKVVKLGRNVTISGVVLPTKTGEVRLTIKRGAATVHTTTAPLRNSAFAITYKPKAIGRYQVTAAFGSGADDAGTTKTTAFSVKRPVRR